MVDSLTLLLLYSLKFKTLQAIRTALFIKARSPTLVCKVLRLRGLGFVELVGLGLFG